MTFVDVWPKYHKIPASERFKLLQLKLYLKRDKGRRIEKEGLYREYPITEGLINIWKVFHVK